MYCAAVDDGATSSELEMKCTRSRWPQTLDAVGGTFSAFLYKWAWSSRLCLNSVEPGEVGVDGLVSRIVDAKPGA